MEVDESRWVYSDRVKDRTSYGTAVIWAGTWHGIWVMLHYLKYSNGMNGGLLRVDGCFFSLLRFQTSETVPCNICILTIVGMGRGVCAFRNTNSICLHHNLQFVWFCSFFLSLFLILQFGKQTILIIVYQHIGDGIVRMSEVKRGDEEGIYMYEIIKKECK